MIRKLLFPLFFCLIGLMARAQMAKGVCGSNGQVEWTLANDGTLTVSGKGLMEHYSTVLLPPWNAYREKIVKVVLEDGVANVGRDAFAHCPHLRNVVLASTVQSISEGAFENSGLEEIQMSTNLRHIELRAFKGCSKLTSITWPKALRTIGMEAFMGCEGLKTLDFPPMLNEIKAYAFKGCTGLKSVDLPRSLTKLGLGVFADCANLTSASVPSSVTMINHIFNRCAKLQSLVLHAHQVVNVSSDASFLGATVYVPKALLSDYRAHNFYREMAAIKAIEDGLPLGLKPEVVIAKDAVMASGVCGNEGENVKWSLAHNGVLTLQGYGYTKNYTKEDEAPWALYREDIKRVVIEEGVRNIGNFMFFQCDSLRSVLMPASLLRIGIASFGMCLKLREVEIPTSVVIVDNGAFTRTGLKTIRFPQSVEKMGMGIFGGCEWLVEAVLPENIKEIDTYMFTGCKRLKSVNIPLGVKRIKEKAFLGCTALDSVMISQSADVAKDALVSTTKVVYVSPKETQKKDDGVAANMLVGKEWRLTYEISGEQSWIPSTVFDHTSDQGMIRSFVFTETELTYKMETKGYRSSSQVFPYYLSTSLPKAFDKKQVGKSNHGQYIIWKVGDEWTYRKIEQLTDNMLKLYTPAPSKPTHGGGDGIDIFIPYPL